MSQKIKYLIIILVAAWSVNSLAQNSQVMYYMRIPQNHLFNPAVKPVSLYYIGLPVLTGINVGFGNNFLDLKKMFPGDTIGGSSWPPANFDLNRLASILKEKNNISADANIQLLGLGFMIGQDLNIFIDVIDRIEAKAVIPKDIMKLYINGYDQFLNQTINLSGLNFRAQYFREVGVGFSKNVTTKLRVGAKAKLLFGMASVNFDNRALSLKVNSDFTQTITADASLDISGQQRMTTLKHDFNGWVPLPGDTIKPNIGQGIKDYVKTPFSNVGLGIDLGAVYNFNKMLSVSAAITDLGYINWKDDLKSYKAKNTFVFQGLSLKDVVQGTVKVDSLFQGIKDTVENSFIKTNPSAYKTYLPTGISLGANMNFFSVLSLGVLSNSKIYAGQIKEALTLSANAYLSRAFSVSLSYTMANYSYNNLGFGLAFKAGPGQIYLIADKIPVKWSKVYIEKGNNGYSAIPIPQNLNMLNFQIGFNISFGKIVSKKVDKPMVVVE